MDKCPRCGKPPNHYWHPYCSLECARADRQAGEISEREYTRLLGETIKKARNGCGL